VFKSDIFKNTTIVFIANLISKFIGFILFASLAKYMGVENYGQLTVLLAIITTVSEMVGAGLNASLVRYSAIYSNENNHIKLNSLISTSLINIIFLGFLIIILTYLFSQDIALLLFKNISFSTYIEISSWGIVFTFFYGIYLSLFLGLQKYKYYFSYSVFFQIVRLSLLYVLIFYNNTSIELVLYIFILSPLFSFIFAMIIERDVKISIYSYDIEVVKETYTFGKWMFLWAVVVIIQSKLDIYLLASLSNMQNVAYFDIAQKFVLATMIVFTSYSAVLKPKMSILKTKEEITFEIRKTYKVIFAMNIFIIAMIFILPYVIRLIFSNDYDNSILPLTIMLSSLIFFVWTLPLNASFYAIGKSEVYFYTACIGLIINTIFSLILIPSYGSVGASISYFIVNISSLIIVYIFYKYYLKNMKIGVYK
jgi:O-antigen/teichoic acid export membrane protein